MIGVVYFLYCQGPDGAGYVKIGTARDVDRRLSDVQSGNPFSVSIIYTMPGGRELEREYHRRFERHRLRGEWFRYAREIIDEIRRLQGLKPLPKKPCCPTCDRLIDEGGQ